MKNGGEYKMQFIHKLPKPMQWLTYYMVVAFAMVSLVVILSQSGNTQVWSVAKILLNTIMLIGGVLMVLAILSVLKEVIKHNDKEHPRAKEVCEALGNTKWGKQ